MSAVWTSGIHYDGAWDNRRMTDIGDLALSGIIRTASAGARVQWNADWSVDFYNAAGEVTLHTDPPSGEMPWLCGGCELCDGDGHLRP